MENIDFNNVYFSWKGMLPENGDTITSMWARRIVKDAFSAYGLIGTIIFTGDAGKQKTQMDGLAYWGTEIQSVNLGLLSKFEYPPFVELYYLNPANGFIEKYDGLSQRKLTYEIQQNVLTVWSVLANVTSVYYRILGL
jgi:hypothetical protein